MVIAETMRLTMKKTAVAASDTDLSITNNVFLGLHDVSACRAFSDRTASTRRVGGTPLGSGHSTASALLRHVFIASSAFFLPVGRHSPLTGRAW
jgi:hypothetical protein